MKLARSSYYYQPQSEDNEQLQTQADLRDRIEEICLEFPGYGYRRVTQQLKRDHRIVNHKKVLRIMRESDLLCRVKLKKTRTTDSKHHFPRYPNLIRNKAIVLLNQVWLADITYIRILTGFVYLAAILDACSRKVIGLCHFERSGDGPGLGSLENGNISQTTGTGSDPSLGPGDPICFRGIYC